MLLSIHDLMPTTLSEVECLVAYLARRGVQRLTLLVVPGLPWQRAQLDVLRRYEDAGYELAGHGWTHALTRPPRGLWHRAHAAFLSRQVAEHLELRRAEIRRLVERNFEWFAQHGLRAPRLYVPPAWALGSFSARDMQAAAFRWFELLPGVYDSQQARWHRLPLAGFEADTRQRAMFLSLFNAVNRQLARGTGRALRVGIHPYDRSHRLAGALDRVLRGPRVELSLDDLAG